VQLRLAPAGAEGRGQGNRRVSGAAILGGCPATRTAGEVPPRRSPCPAPREWRGVGRVAAALVTALLVGACTGGGTGEGGLSVTWRLDPTPPAVGPAALELRLIDPAGEPVDGAAIEVEANMNHAGMVPVFASLEETAPGTYEGTVDFTMGGDWFLLVEATLDDGRTVERTLDVKGVRP